MESSVFLHITYFSDFQLLPNKFNAPSLTGSQAAFSLLVRLSSWVISQPPYQGPYLYYSNDFYFVRTAAHIQLQEGKNYFIHLSTSEG